MESKKKYIQEFCDLKSSVYKKKSLVECELRFQV